MVKPESVTAGVPPLEVAVPERATMAGEFSESFDRMYNDPVRAPAVDGSKLTVTVAEVPGASVKGGVIGDGMSPHYN